MHKTFKNIVNENLIYYLKNIESEVLLLWGKLDTATPIKDGYKMNNLIKDSALIIFPKGNHFSYLQYPCRPADKAARILQAGSAWIVHHFSSEAVVGSTGLFGY